MRICQYQPIAFPYLYQLVTNPKYMSKSHLFEMLHKCSIYSIENTIVSCFFIRDYRNGMGCRLAGRWAFEWIGMEHPLLFIQIVSLIPIYGRWDDLLYLLTRNTLKSLHTYILQLFKVQLHIDILNMMTGNDTSLLPKWLPTENKCFHKKYPRLFTTLLKFLDFSKSTYRKHITALREHLNLLEKRICTKQFHSINYATLTATNIKKYNRIFHKFDHDTFSQYPHNTPVPDEYKDIHPRNSFYLSFPRIPDINIWVHRIRAYILNPTIKQDNTNKTQIEHEWSNFVYEMDTYDLFKHTYVLHNKTVLPLDYCHYQNSIAYCSVICMNMIHQYTNTIGRIRFEHDARNICPNWVLGETCTSFYDAVDFVTNNMSDCTGTTLFENIYDSLIRYYHENSTEPENALLRIVIPVAESKDECLELYSRFQSTDEWYMYTSMFETLNYPLPELVLWNISDTYELSIDRNKTSNHQHDFFAGYPNWSTPFWKQPRCRLSMIRYFNTHICQYLVENEHDISLSNHGYMQFLLNHPAYNCIKSLIKETIQTKNIEFSHL